MLSPTLVSDQTVCNVSFLHEFMWIHCRVSRIAFQPVLPAMHVGLVFDSGLGLGQKAVLELKAVSELMALRVSRQARKEHE